MPSLLEDGLLFVLRFVDCVEESAQHVYHSALLLAPRSSLLRQAHARNLKSEGTLIRGCDHWDNLSALRIKTSTPPFTLALSHDGRMLAAGSSTHIEVFTLVTGKSLYMLRPNLCGERFNTPIRFVGDDSMILAGRGSRAEVWDLKTGFCIHSYRCPGPEPWSVGDVQVVDMSPNKHYVACGYQASHICVWEMGSEVLMNQINAGSPIQFISFSPSSDSLFICLNGILQCRELKSDTFDVFKSQDAFDSISISDDRSLLAACSLDMHTLTWYVTLFETATKNRIWRRSSKEEIRVLSVLPSLQELWILSKSSFHVWDSSCGRPSLFPSASSSGIQLKHDFSNVEMDSSVVTSDGKYIAYINNNRSGAYIHHLQNTRHTENSQPSPDVFDIRTTVDGTMGVVWRLSFNQIRVCSVYNEVILASPDISKLSDYVSASLTPNSKFMAIVGGVGHTDYIVQLWDLDQASLAWEINMGQVDDCAFHSIDDNTCLITAKSGSLLGIFYPSNFGFISADGQTVRTSASGNAGSSWRFLSLELTGGAYLINFKASQRAGQRFYDLKVTANISSCPPPQYNLSSLDSRGWLIDNHGNKILWIPHDCRTQFGMGWGTGKRFATGGENGIITAIDFSDVRDVLLTDRASLWVQHRQQLTAYMAKLREVPWAVSAIHGARN